MVLERAVHQNRSNEELDQQGRDSMVRSDGGGQTPASIARQLLALKLDIGAAGSIGTGEHPDTPKTGQILQAIEALISAFDQRAREIAEGKIAPPTPWVPSPADETQDDTRTGPDDDALLRHDTAVIDRDAVIAAVADVDSLVGAQVVHDAVPPDIEHDVESSVLGGVVDVPTELVDEELQEQLVDAVGIEPSETKSEPPPAPPRSSEPVHSRDRNHAATPTTPPTSDGWPTQLQNDDGLDSDPFGRQSDLDEVVWSRDIELLYEDVIYLFQSSDTEGALISLERLLIVAPANEAIQEFVALNEKKLVDVYERLIGPWTKIPRRNVDSRAMPTSYLRDAKIEKVARLIDGSTAVEEIFGKVRFGRLEVCCILSQLQRARLIQLVAPPTVN
ncbi:MAG: hypothetical protein HUU55_13430 [Myxococcales bacterium]|nr:hypothetical protein [Myxococcales bacterium]